jgi:hypothetical protein
MDSFSIPITFFDQYDTVSALKRTGNPITDEVIKRSPYATLEPGETLKYWESFDTITSNLYNLDTVSLDICLPRLTPTAQQALRELFSSGRLRPDTRLSTINLATIAPDILFNPATLGIYQLFVTQVCKIYSKINYLLVTYSALNYLGVEYEGPDFKLTVDSPQFLFNRLHPYIERIYRDHSYIERQTGVAAATKTEYAWYWDGLNIATRLLPP